jgi:hypothetical protein
MKKYVIIAATIMMDIASLEAEMKGMGMFMRIGFIILTAAIPPIADASTATRVMPIWMVARNLFGSPLSLSRTIARLLPASMSCLTRVLLSVTTAISDAAKIPFKMIKMKIRRMSGHIN